MLMAGRNIRCTTDKMQRVKVEYLYHSIRSPKPEIATMLRLLRTIKYIDNTRYSLVKKQLPYFTCATFVPPFLSLENFAYIEHFVIDVQNLEEKGMDIDKLRNHISQDSRVVLIYATPSKNGLKIMFSLKERCYDNGVFNVFYNLFLKEFFEKNHLDIDILTTDTDVTDVCFISVDEQAYYNPNAQPIDIDKYIEEENPTFLLDSMREMRHVAKENVKTLKSSQDKTQKESDPTQETLLHIKEVLLGTKSVERDKKSCVDSGAFEDLMLGLKQFVEDQGVEMKSVKHLSNARKAQIVLEDKIAEVNIFRGNKGFFAVQSPTGGNSKEFGKIVLEIVNAYLVHVSLDNISKYLKDGLMKDRFNFENESFEQMETKVENKYSVNIPMRYYYKGRFLGEKVGLFSRV